MSSAKRAEARQRGRFRSSFKVITQSVTGRRAEVIAASSRRGGAQANGRRLTGGEAAA